MSALPPQRRAPQAPSAWAVSEVEGRPSRLKCGAAALPPGARGGQRSASRRAARPGLDGQRHKAKEASRFRDPLCGIEDHEGRGFSVGGAQGLSAGGEPGPPGWRSRSVLHHPARPASPSCSPGAPFPQTTVVPLAQEHRPQRKPPSGRQGRVPGGHGWRGRAGGAEGPDASDTTSLGPKESGLPAHSTCLWAGLGRAQLRCSPPRSPFPGGGSQDSIRQPPIRRCPRCCPQSSPEKRPRPRETQLTMQQRPQAVGETRTRLSGN